MTHTSMEATRGTATSERLWPVLFCLTMTEAEEAIRDRDFIHPLLFRGIRRMIEENRTAVVCLELFCHDAITSIWVNMRADDVHYALEAAMQWRIDREDYEDCSEIQRLEADWNRYASEINK